MARSTPRVATSQVNQPYSRIRGSSAQNSDYEEFASLQLDKPNEAELKTTEEMKKHLFDDHFEGKPIERAMHILTVGEEVQRLSVIRDLPTLLLGDEEGCMQRVIQKIQQALNNATTEFHIETARSYSVILQKKAVSPHTFVHNFLPSVILHVDNRDQVASNAWLETLLSATELLPLDIVKNHIFGVAINKGQISQNVSHRIAACKLLGKICSRFDSNVVKKDILPVVLSLCQDVNETVRACICSQLHLVAKGVPLDMIKSALIPILVELGRDETVQVRVEATETIVKIIPFLNPDLIKVSIIPLIKKICEQAVVAIDETLVMVAKQFGSICISLEGILTTSEKLWLVSYYHNLSHMGIPLHGTKKDVFYPGHNMDRINARYIECRQYCAYNFPAMAKFCSTNPELLEKVYPSLCDFSTDPYYMIRKTIGAGMHEVARILGRNNRVVKNQVLTLLWDNMEEVLMGIVPNLGRTIDYLISSGVLAQEQGNVTFELGRGLLQCDKTIREKTHNWRLYTDFITQLESVVKCLPSDYIYSHFVALMFEKMHRARPLPCRLAAAKTLLIFLRYNLKNNQRQEIRSRLQSEFCLSSSCYKRMLFLRLCNIAREVFSRAYFKEHFFYPLLSRSEDKVANNRLLLIRQFPSLKAMIVMPVEKKYLQTLESCVRTMAVSEKDRDVSAELRTLIHRLEKTETLFETSPGSTADDVEDRRKYEEEMRVANNIIRPGGSVPAGGSIAPQDNRRVQAVQPRVETKPPPPQPKPNGQRPVNPPAPSTPSSSSTPGSSPRTERVASYASASPHAVPSSARSAPPSAHPVPSSPAHSVPSSARPSYASTSTPHSGSFSGNVQGFSNTTNHPISLRSHLSTNDTTNIGNGENCTCYFRPEHLRNLNLLALIDESNLSESNRKFSRIFLERKFSDLENFRWKGLGSSSSSSSSSSSNRPISGMEISWLNLEADLKSELIDLVGRSRGIRGGGGDRNYNEKIKFLTDFRNCNELINLSRLAGGDDDRDYCKEAIQNSKRIGLGNSSEKNVSSNFFEERLNFFEKKLKLENGNSNPGDCSCHRSIGTNHRIKSIEESIGETKRISYFSRNFEEDFYRDAGVKANEVIRRKFSSVSGHEKSAVQMSSAKISALNKRRTWLGNENCSLSSPVKLETITGCGGKTLARKKSETLPARESCSGLKDLGIGPRSKSFILPSTLISSGKKIPSFQVGKQSAPGKENEPTKLEAENRENRSLASRANPDANRFGFRSKSREILPPKEEARMEKSLGKTRIPMGRVSNEAGPGEGRSESPISFREKPEERLRVQGNGAKKASAVVSRKSMLIQSNAVKSEMKNNRRSLDPTKISLANLDKVQGGTSKRRNERILGKEKKGETGGAENCSEVKEDKGEGETASVNSSSSKLPIRRPRPDK